MTWKKSLLALIAVITLGISAAPAEAQYYHHHHHYHHRHCYYRHGRRYCRYY